MPPGGGAVPMPASVSHLSGAATTTLGAAAAASAAAVAVAAAAQTATARPQSRQRAVGTWCPPPVASPDCRSCSSPRSMPTSGLGSARGAGSLHAAPPVGGLAHGLSSSGSCTSLAGLSAGPPLSGGGTPASLPGPASMAFLPFAGVAGVAGGVPAVRPNDASGTGCGSLAMPICAVAGAGAGGSGTWQPPAGATAPLGSLTVPVGAGAVGSGAWPPPAGALAAQPCPASEPGSHCMAPMALMGSTSQPPNPMGSNSPLPAAPVGSTSLPAAPAGSRAMTPMPASAFRWGSPTSETRSDSVNPRVARAVAARSMSPPLVRPSSQQTSMAGADGCSGASPLLPFGACGGNGFPTAVAWHPPLGADQDTLQGSLEAQQGGLTAATPPSVRSAPGFSGACGPILTPGARACSPLSGSSAASPGSVPLSSVSLGLGMALGAGPCSPRSCAGGSVGAPSVNGDFSGISLNAVGPGSHCLAAYAAPPAGAAMASPGLVSNLGNSTATSASSMPFGHERARPSSRSTSPHDGHRFSFNMLRQRPQQHALRMQQLQMQHAALMQLSATLPDLAGGPGASGPTGPVPASVSPATVYTPAASSQPSVPKGNSSEGPPCPKCRQPSVMISRLDDEAASGWFCEACNLPVSTGSLAVAPQSSLPFAAGPWRPPSPRAASLSPQPGSWQQQRPEEERRRRPSARDSSSAATGPPPPTWQQMQLQPQHAAPRRTPGPHLAPSRGSSFGGNPIPRQRSAGSSSAASTSAAGPAARRNTAPPGASGKSSGAAGGRPHSTDRTGPCSTYAARPPGQQPLLNRPTARKKEEDEALSHSCCRLQEKLSNVRGQGSGTGGKEPQRNVAATSSFNIVYSL